jgi:hypothetical protein
VESESKEGEQNRLGMRRRRRRRSIPGPEISARISVTFSSLTWRTISSTGFFEYSLTSLIRRLSTEGEMFSFEDWERKRRRRRRRIRRGQQAEGGGAFNGESDLGRGAASER